MRYVFLMLIGVALVAPAAAQQSPNAADVPVTTVIAEARPISQTKDFVGRIEAIERVDVRARVTGYLEAILFKEGELVKEGQPLYRIERDLFKAAVEQAQGAFEGTKASKKLTLMTPGSQQLTQDYVTFNSTVESMLEQAGKDLRDPKTPKKDRGPIASALAQTPRKKKRK